MSLSGQPALLIRLQTSIPHRRYAGVFLSGQLRSHDPPAAVLRQPVQGLPDCRRNSSAGAGLRRQRCLAHEASYCFRIGAAIIWGRGPSPRQPRRHDLDQNRHGQLVLVLPACPRHGRPRGAWSERECISAARRRTVFPPVEMIMEDDESRCSLLGRETHVGSTADGDAVD